MKKIRNMTYEDAKKAFESFLKKHSIDDDFDMNYSIINAVQPLLTDKEALINTFYDVFCYGFMAGYKQKEKEVKDHMESHMFNEYQRKLVELAYYLPFGIGAEEFYTYVVLRLHHEEGEATEKYLPAKQRKPFVECYKASEQRQEKRNEEARREREQKRAAMTPEEKERSNLKCEVTQKILYVEDLEKLKQIKAIIENETGTNKKE